MIFTLSFSQDYAVSSREGFIDAADAALLLRGADDYAPR